MQINNSDIQKGLVCATSAVFLIADELVLTQNRNRPPNIRNVMDHTDDSSTMLAKAHQQILA